jgi:hypothetical protein
MSQIVTLRMTADAQPECAHLWGFHCSFLHKGAMDQQIPVKCMVCSYEDTWTRIQCLTVLVSIFVDNAKKRKRATLAELMEQTL